MLQFTICFIIQGDRVLLLNREKPAWMGRWNGVGGKINPNESPQLSVLREVYEETGLLLEKVYDKGIVTWEVDGVDQGGMHLFLAYLPEDVIYETPRKMREGILDWKALDWVLHPENEGVASNIRYFLPAVLQDERRFDHHCIFRNGLMVGYDRKPCRGMDERDAKKIAGM